MIQFRHLILLPLVLCGCDPLSSASQADNTTLATDTTEVVLSPEEQNLLKGGGERKDIVAARAFIAPFTRTDQNQCFGDAKLEAGEMAERGGVQSPVPSRVVIAIDGSGSMAGRIGGLTKLELAWTAATSFVNSLPPGIPASLAVFGQQGDNSTAGKARSCSSVDLLAPMSVDRAQLRTALSSVRAVGWTPLAAGLTAARNTLSASSVTGEQLIYVVSDGIKTCGRDPVAVARDINQGKTRAVVNIIGFGLPKADAATLQSVASAGGGRFVNIADDTDFDRVLEEQMRRAKNRVAATMTRSSNTIATGASTNEVTLSTGRIIEREQHDALAAYDMRTARGEKLPPRYQVVALVRERQHKLEAARAKRAHAMMLTKRSMPRRRLPGSELQHLRRRPCQSTVASANLPRRSN